MSRKTDKALEQIVNDHVPALTGVEAQDLITLLNIATRAGAFSLDHVTALAIITRKLVAIRGPKQETPSGQDSNPAS